MNLGSRWQLACVRSRSPADPARNFAFRLTYRTSLAMQDMLEPPWDIKQQRDIACDCCHSYLRIPSEVLHHAASFWYLVLLIFWDDLRETHETLFPPGIKLFTGRSSISEQVYAQRHQCCCKLDCIIYYSHISWCDMFLESLVTLSAFNHWSWRNVIKLRKFPSVTIHACQL